jgi:hypothetical protein
MFTMMNNARLAVGNQGVGIAERAYQQAVEYAHERRQGRALGGSGPADGGMSPIVAHPDVRRMLMTMRALTEASRAICYATAAAIDWSRVAADEAGRAAAQARVEILTPIAKACSTDAGCEVASLGVQIHGGMGFIEETGAAQHMRDARILPIYEGTNGIQAIDLVARKLPLEGGGAMRRLIGEMQATAQALGASGDAALQVLGEALGVGIKVMADASLWLGGKLVSAPNDALAGATPYLRLAGLVVGGWLLGKEGLAVIKRGGSDDAGRAKLDTIRFYATNLMPQAAGLAAAATSGVDTLGAEPAEVLAS